jgi:hypothetical protein
VLEAPCRERELDQGQGVSDRLVENAPLQIRRQLRGPSLEEAVGFFFAQAAERELRKPGTGDVTRQTCPDGEPHQCRLHLESARNEPEHHSRRSIEPLCVVDDEEHRPVRRDVGHEPQRGEADQIDVGDGFARNQGERHLEGVPLKLGEPVEPVEERQQQLVQPGEGQARLGLHRSGPEHAHPLPTCPCRRRCQQGRLADTRVPANHERTAAAVNPVDEAREPRQLLLSADQDRRRLGSRPFYAHALSWRRTGRPGSPTAAG